MFTASLPQPQGSAAAYDPRTGRLNLANAPDFRAWDTTPRAAPPDFERVKRAALAVLPALLHRWVPGGRREGGEWVARNPTRQDRRAGSFRVSLRTGRWADFAAAARGGDPVSLAAYLFDLTQAEAARRLAEMLGVR